eukprot:m.161295 g.161295  ORF g.161295 m.161295 type:complete len:287 (+) comp38813_c1_seq13:435-1295(+)
MAVFQKLNSAQPESGAGRLYNHSLRIQLCTGTSMALVRIFCILFAAAACTSARSLASAASRWGGDLQSSGYEPENNSCSFEAICSRGALIIKAAGKEEETRALTWTKDSGDVTMMKTMRKAIETNIFVEKRLPNDQSVFQTLDKNKYLGVDKEGQLVLKKNNSTRFLHFKLHTFTDDHYVLLAIRPVKLSEQCFLLRPNRSSIKLMNPKFCSSSSDFYQNIFKNKVCFAMESIVNNPINWFQKERVVKKQKRKCGVFTRCSSHVDPALLNCCPCDSCTPPTRRKFH